MSRSKQLDFKHRFVSLISNYKIIFVIYLLTAAATALSKYNRGPEAYNNYLIFKRVFFNAREHRNIFLQQPEYFFDSNHYGIFFSLLIAPFAVLPDWLGMVLWNMANTAVFLFAVHKLPFSSQKKSFFAWLCLQEFITASLYFQFNIALTGLLILSAVFIYEKKELKSAAAILIGAFVKIYGIVGLSSFFFVKNKKRYLSALRIGTVICFFLPVIIAGKDFTIQSYFDWYASLTQKNEENQVLGSRQDYSLMGVVRRILQNPDISNLYFLVPGAVVFLLPYIRFKQFQKPAFQMMILASTLLFVVLFSSGSESPTYIIAVAGVMIWFLMQRKYQFWEIFLLIFVLILTCFSFSDLFPKWAKEQYIIKYSLKAVPCIFVWFRIMYELLTRDFSKDYQLA